MGRLGLPDGAIRAPEAAAFEPPFSDWSAPFVRLTDDQTDNVMKPCASN